MPSLRTEIPDKGDRREKDPYEAWYRHQRRQHRLQIAMVIGAFFLAVFVVSGLVVLNYLATDDPVVAANTASSSH